MLQDKLHDVMIIGNEVTIKYVAKTGELALPLHSATNVQHYVRRKHTLEPQFILLNKSSYSSSW